MTCLAGAASILPTEDTITSAHSASILTDTQLVFRGVVSTFAFFGLISNELCQPSTWDLLDSLPRRVEHEATRRLLQVGTFQTGGAF